MQCVSRPSLSIALAASERCPGIVHNCCKIFPSSAPCQSDPGFHTRESYKKTYMQVSALSPEPSALLRPFLSLRYVYSVSSVRAARPLALVARISLQSSPQPPAPFDLRRRAPRRRRGAAAGAPQSGSACSRERACTECRASRVRPRGAARRAKCPTPTASQPPGTRARAAR